MPCSLGHVPVRYVDCTVVVTAGKTEPIEASLPRSRKALRRGVELANESGSQPHGVDDHGFVHEGLIERVAQCVKQLNRVSRIVHLRLLGRLVEKYLESQGRGEQFALKWISCRQHF